MAYTPFFYSHGFSTSVPNSIKRPLENRVWYAYPDQDASGIAVGTWIGPTRAARVLDDGASQISRATYNGQGQVTSRTDPAGRQTAYAYAANGIDLVEARQTSSGVNDLSGNVRELYGATPTADGDRRGRPDDHPHLQRVRPGAHQHQRQKRDDGAGKYDVNHRLTQ